MQSPITVYVIAGKTWKGWTTRTLWTKRDERGSRKTWSAWIRWNKGQVGRPRPPWRSWIARWSGESHVCKQNLYVNWVLDLQMWGPVQYKCDARALALTFSFTLHCLAVFLWVYNGGWWCTKNVQKNQTNWFSEYGSQICEALFDQIIWTLINL